MTARGWITLVVRAIGLWSVLLGATRLTETLCNPHDIALFETNGSATIFPTPLNLREGADDLLWLLAGCYLLFGGKLLINRFCAQVVGRCPKCGYDLTGADAGASCPECGAPPR